MKTTLKLLFILVLFLPSLALASGVSYPPAFPGGTTGQIQYNNNGVFGGLTNAQVRSQIGGAPATASDYLDFPVDAGIDSVLGAPNAAVKINGNVSSAMTATPANVSYGTGTVSAPNFTNMVWGSGTQTATLTLSGLTAGSLYQLLLTPTVTGQVPTISVTSGVSQYSPLVAIVSGVQQSIYFMASGTSAVFTFTNTAASTWSTASTTCYSQAQSTIVRDFSNSAMQSLVFKWFPPNDWNAGTVTMQPIFIFDAATPPTATQTVVWQFEGACKADTTTLAQTYGASQTSTYTATGSPVQYQIAVGPATSAITLTGAATGTVCTLKIDRMTSGTYAQSVGLADVVLQFSRTPAP